MRITFLSKHIFYLAILILTFTTSCATKKNLIYFQSGTTPDSTAVKVANTNYTPIFRSDDFLSIDVMAMDLETAKTFNLPVLNNSTPSGYNNGYASKYGYLIDAQGMIEFPMLGKIKLAGLDRMQATELIQNKLKDYIANPIVSIRILNYKITVLGDVKVPGTYNIPNERLTLPEALGLAGDLNMTGIRKNILVIRDVDGVKTETRVDLTSKEVFSSPVYYLTQNDVIYVEPNRAKRNSSVISSTAGVFISVASLLITTINVITN